MNLTNILPFFDISIKQLLFLLLLIVHEYLLE